jgi:hypothetical protein
MIMSIYTKYYLIYIVVSVADWSNLKITKPDLGSNSEKILFLIKNSVTLINFVTVSQRFDKPEQINLFFHFFSTILSKLSKRCETLHRFTNVTPILSKR